MRNRRISLVALVTVSLFSAVASAGYFAYQYHGGENWTDCVQPYSNFRGADFGNAVLDGCSLPQSTFYGADFHHASLLGVDASSSSFYGADFQHTRFGPYVKTGKNANLSNSEFNGTDLRRADFAGANLSGAVFIDADLSNANLGGANLDGAVFNRADLRDANLCGTSRQGNL